jgi:pimeloyl-ACP methyl ester carboxylesterase
MTQEPRRRRRRVGSYMRTVAFYLASFVSLASAQTQPIPPAPPPPGELIALQDGRHLHANCSGNGSPTVIIENGAGAFSMDWALVQPQVARFTRVCTYDRAGYAWSDAGPVQDGIEQTLQDLRAMLRQESVTPPYVFVGASLGALFVRAYQRRFPQQVAGLVFVDGSHDEAITFYIDGRNVPLSWLPAAELPQIYARYEKEAPKPSAGSPSQPPLDRLPPALQQTRFWAFAKFVSEVGLLPKGLTAAESWRREFSILRQQRLARPHPLGDLPLRVLERTLGTNEIWQAQQRELARLSSTGKLVSVANSGHMINLYQPEAVTQAIREVVDLAQRRSAHNR